MIRAYSRTITVMVSCSKPVPLVRRGLAAWFAFAATAVGASAQESVEVDCATCEDTKLLLCKWHGDTWDHVKEAEIYSEWAAREFECCGLLGATDCPVVCSRVSWVRSTVPTGCRRSRSDRLSSRAGTNDHGTG